MRKYINEITDEIIEEYSNPIYEDIKLYLKDCLITQNILEYVGYLNYIGKIDERFEIMGGFLNKINRFNILEISVDEDYEKYYRKIFIGFLLNDIYDEVNNILFTFIPKFTHKDFLVNTEDKGGSIFFHMKRDKMIQIYDFVNLYLQMILCLNSINQYYSFSHNEIDEISATVRLSGVKILNYIVLLNGKKVKINLKPGLYKMKLGNFENSSITYNNKNISGVPFPEYDIYDLTKLFIGDGKYAILGLIDKFKQIKNFIYSGDEEFTQDKIAHTYDEILGYILYESKFKKYFDFSDLEIPEYKKCKIVGNIDILLQKKLLNK